MTAEDAVPRGRFKRGSILGAAVVRASATKAGQSLTQPFRSRAERARAKRQSDEAVAKALFDACSALRGTPLKLAQVLANERELLPEAYRNQFSLASHRVEPINRALVGKLLRVELGDPNKLFRHFEDVPFAAASLGQVHAATSLAGDALAVKLQYPGIADGVASDLRLVRTLLGPTPWGRMFDACYEDLREGLCEELDYRAEAAHTTWFHEHLRLPGVVVPRVHPGYTTSHVIATERLAGMHVDEYLAIGPSEDERNRFGQLLVDLFHHCLFEIRCLHADPNFGNYLFGDDGTLGLIDFGCVRRLEPHFTERLASLFALHSFEGAAVLSLTSQLGVKYRGGSAEGDLQDFLARWSEWVVAPYQAPSFDFGANADYFERGFAMSEEARRYVECADGSFLYFGRAHHGLQRLLQTLGATVRMRIPNAS